MMSPASNDHSLRQMAARLTGMEAVHPPDAPGATIVMGLLQQDSEAMTFAGCSLDPEQAFRACMGEAAEYLAQSDPRAGLVSESVPDDAITRFEPLFTEPSRSWLRGMTFPSGALVSLPAASCCYLSASRHLDISSGCAAGRTIDQAIHHGLCELIERDAARHWWYGHRHACSMDPKHPALSEAMEWLAVARGGVQNRDVMLLDVGADAVIPVIAAISSLKSGGGFVLATAAHPSVVEAAKSALREMVQMEFGLLLASMRRERAGLESLSQVDRRHIFRAETMRADNPVLQPEQQTGLLLEARDRSAMGSVAIASALIARGHDVFAARLSDDPFLPVVRMLVTDMPIATRAPPLTCTDNLWKYSGMVDLY